MSDWLKVSRENATRFEVAVFKYEGGWRVEISDPGRKRVGRGAFAAVEAGDLDTAMQMAVPYLASVAEPMPWMDMLAAHAAAVVEGEENER